MKISELSAGQSEVNITATVAGVEEPREVTTKFGTQITLVNAILKDDSGEIRLTLWGDQANGIAEGKTVEIQKGFVKEFREQLQLGVGKEGSIKVVE